MKIKDKIKLIDMHKVSDASVHDTQALDLLISESDENQPLYADSPYTGLSNEKSILDDKMTNQDCEKVKKDQPLTADQQASNRTKSKIRVRMEHVFGFMKQSMRGLYIGSIGMARATGIIGMVTSLKTSSDLNNS